MATVGRIVEGLKRCKTPALQDALDALGLFDQSFPPGHKLVNPAARGRRVVGRARTFACYPLDERPRSLPIEVAIENLRRVRDYVGEGDFVVFGHEPGIPPCEDMGGMMSVFLEKIGVSGVIARYVRDLDEIQATNLAVFAQGTHPAIRRLRAGVRPFGTPLSFGSLRVSCGDYIVADSDGIVVVPQDPSIIDEILQRLQDWETLDAKIQRDFLGEGLSLEDVLRKHGTF